MCDGWWHLVCLCAQEQMTQVVEGQSARLEELEKEHARKTRELKDLNAELSAKVEALRDTLDGEGQGRGPRGP